MWNYLGSKIDLEFKAGFVAATQDVDTGMIKPVIGWFLSKEAAKEITYEEKEGLEDGHCDIYNNWDYD